SAETGWPSRRSPEVAAQRLEREALALDLGGAAQAEPAKDRLERVAARERAQQKRRAHDGRNQEEAPPHEHPEREPDKAGGGGLELDRPVEIPFAIERVQAQIDGLRRRGERLELRAEPDIVHRAPDCLEDFSCILPAGAAGVRSPFGLVPLEGKATVGG